MAVDRAMHLLLTSATACHTQACLAKLTGATEHCVLQCCGKELLVLAMALLHVEKLWHTLDISTSLLIGKSSE